jgi:hypothetical protein
VIKNIVSCGCSYVAGCGCSTPLQERLSALFAKKYNAEDINFAIDGGSNDRSVRKITNWVVENKNKLDETLFLIGVTQPQRFEIYTHIWKGGRHLRYAELFTVNSDLFNAKMGVKTTLRNIFLLTTVFEKYNCKYIIFDVIDNIKTVSLGGLPNPSDKYYDEVFGNKNYYSKESWMDFCSPRGKGLFAAEDKRMLIGASKGFEGDWGHPSAKGNQKWFEVLSNYAEENKLW